MSAGILLGVADGHGGKRDGAGAPKKERPKVAVPARISADAYDKLVRLAERYGGIAKRGAMTKALEEAILAAPEDEG